MPSLTLTLLASALLLAGCDTARPDTAQGQTEADLRLEVGATGEADGLTVTFEAVTTDSRCPEDAQCIWAGEARVRLVVNGTTEELLATDPELAPDAFVRRGNGILRAVGLSPYPGSRGEQRGDTPVVVLQTEIVAD